MPNLMLRGLKVGVASHLDSNAISNTIVEEKVLRDTSGLRAKHSWSKTVARRKYRRANLLKIQYRFDSLTFIESQH